MLKHSISRYTAILMILGALGAQGRASTREQLEADVLAWAGQGESAAFVVIDFDDSTTDSAEFVFGVRFGSDGAMSISGLAALQTLAEADVLEIVDAGGGFITDITYVDGETTYHGSGEYPPWWSYWESADYGVTYQSSMVGAAGHLMADGDTSGWLNTHVLWPDTPPAPNGPRLTPRARLEGDVIEWAGQGESAAFVVIDFDDSTTDSAEFVFGVRFGSDGATSISGLAALQTLAEADVLTIVDLGGGFITDITYVDGDTTYHGSGEYPPWWSYWESVDFGVTYQSSMTGAATHYMADGDTSGWLNTHVLWPDSPPAPNGPRVTRSEKPKPPRPATAVWYLY